MIEVMIVARNTEKRSPLHAPYKRDLVRRTAAMWEHTLFTLPLHSPHYSASCSPARVPHTTRPMAPYASSPTMVQIHVQIKGLVEEFHGGEFCAENST